MPQEIALYNEFTIRETMKYFGWIAKMSTEDVEDRLCFLTNLLMLPDIDRKVKNLSGGQQRRVSFATVLLHEPELLILDEPTVGLDPLLRETIWNHLTEITKDRSTTVILTTHYIEETRQAGLIGLMRSGYIMAEESPASILSRFETDTLEDAFLKLSIMQNMGRRKRSIAARAVASAVVLPSGIVNQALDVDDDHHHEISAEFGDGLTTSKTGRRFSLVAQEAIPQLPQEPVHKAELGDYLLHLEPRHMKALIWKNFLWILRNWPIMLTVIALPVTQFAIFYLAVGHTPTNLNIAIVDYESGDRDCHPLSCNGTRLGCNYLEYLKKKKIHLIRYETEGDAIDAVNRGETYASVIVKENYTTALKARISNGRRSDEWDMFHSTIDVYRDASVKDISTFLRFYFYDSFMTFIADYMDSCELNRNALKLPLQWNAPVYGTVETDFTEFATPGVLITIAFFLAAALTAVAMLVERNEGILERSLVMGVSPVEVLTSHVVSEFVLMMIQIVAVTCCGLFIFRMKVMGSLVLFIILLSLSGFCGMWFGFALSSMCDNETSAAYILLGSFFPLILLCGVIWPIEGMVHGLQLVAQVLPLTQPVEGLRSIMQRGWSMRKPPVYHGYITISMWTLLFIIFSVVLIKYKRG
ncbi:ABC transporter G family member 20-like isoform X2 [Photinus pyralis]|nr:ABC transporter G family member 20-like isoform X2 [Photinus pyralis]